MRDQYQALEEILKQRHSCRGFRPDPVPRDRIEQIVDAARRAPSWCNAQPWQLIITSGAETERLRKALRAEAEANPPAPDMPWPARYSGIYLDRRRACGFQLYQAMGVARGDRVASGQQMLRNFDLFDAPHMALIHTPADLGAYGALDCGGFVTAFTLAATALGVATIPQAAVASYSPFLHDWFAIPDDRLILCAISFGHADPEHPANRFRTDRAAVSEIVDWRGKAG